MVLVWTAALEFPVPDPGNIPERELIYSLKFYVGKSLHLAVYAWMAAYSSKLTVPVRYRWLVMFFLMFHAWGTEMLQKLLEDYCHRGGKLSDVGIDILGIAIGVALSWKRWTEP